jgi:Secretion system C-terminal sorting domain
MARSNGIDIDGPDVNNQWFSDGYGDFIRHFMTGMAAVPVWTPFNQTHLLRSSSVVKSIIYGLKSVDYVTYDATATDVLHVNFNPVTITADGVILPHRSDLSQPGWTLDAATKTLKIYHTSGTQISINTQAAGALPITLGEFTVTINNNNSVYLEWKTYSESNSKQFEIERSIDGVNFERINIIAGAGNSASIKYYNYTDDNLPGKNKVYYRLKLVDIDGQYQYSKTLLLRFKAGSFYVNNIYPQPASDIIHIDVTNVNAATNCTISFINLNGSVVKRSAMVLNKGNSVIDINIPSLSKGVYILKINNDQTQVVERLIKE